MQATAEKVQPSFKGKAEQKELAGRVFELTRATARFFSPVSPITVPLSALAEHIASADGTDSASAADLIDAALSANKHIFAREDRDGVIFFTTSGVGVAPDGEETVDSSHSFAKRFMDPPPVPANALPPRGAKARAESSVVDDLPTESSSGSGTDDVTEPSDDVEPADERGTPSQETSAEVVETITNLDEATEDELVQALRDQLAYDYAVANFGDEWMAEDKVPRLSRGDVRRIKDYIVEQGNPVSDHQIVQDLLGIRQNAQEYPLHRFSVNFRLSRETREFEFVGISGAHFWTTSGIAGPDVVHRKANEVGQDYRVLLDLADEPVMADEGVVEHVLTFYEHRHGVLPYDAAFRSIIPGAVLEGQRAAIIQFESPLTSQNFPVEVRFPTGNRGGFLTGFADFFKEHLVPGAFVTIEAADQPGKYTIEFLTVSGQDRKLLALDEKKQEYKFESRTFYCAPNEDMLVAENRLPKLAGAKPLDERTRRQPEKVLAHAFSYIGEHVESGSSKLMAVMDELVAAANIERPLPAELIRSLAASDNHPEFSIDPEADDVVYFEPGTDTESSD
jgi:hypothetical protein